MATSTAVRHQHVLILADMITGDQHVTGEDLADMIAQIDTGDDPADYTGSGQQIHHALLAASEDCNEDAYTLMQSVYARLGW